MDPVKQVLPTLAKNLSVLLEIVTCIECCKYFVKPKTAPCSHSLCATCWYGRRCCADCGSEIQKNLLDLNSDLERRSSTIYQFVKSVEKWAQIQIQEYLEYMPVSETIYNPETNTDVAQYFAAPTVNGQKSTSESFELDKVHNTILMTRPKSIKTFDPHKNVVYVTFDQEDFDKIEVYPGTDSKDTGNVADSMDVNKNDTQEENIINVYMEENNSQKSRITNSIKRFSIANNEMPVIEKSPQIFDSIAGNHDVNDFFDNVPRMTQSSNNDSSYRYLINDNNYIIENIPQSIKEKNIPRPINIHYKKLPQNDKYSEQSDHSDYNHDLPQCRDDSSITVIDDLQKRIITTNSIDSTLRFTITITNVVGSNSEHGSSPSKQNKTITNDFNTHLAGKRSECFETDNKPTETTIHYTVYCQECPNTEIYSNVEGQPKGRKIVSSENVHPNTQLPVESNANYNKSPELSRTISTKRSYSNNSPELRPISPKRSKSNYSPELSRTISTASNTASANNITVVNFQHFRNKPQNESNLKPATEYKDIGLVNLKSKTLPAESIRETQIISNKRLHGFDDDDNSAETKKSRTMITDYSSEPIPHAPMRKVSPEAQKKFEVLTSNTCADLPVTKLSEKNSDMEFLQTQMSSSGQVGYEKTVFEKPRQMSSHSRSASHNSTTSGANRYSRDLGLNTNQSGIIDKYAGIDLPDTNNIQDKEIPDTTVAMCEFVDNINYKSTPIAWKNVLSSAENTGEESCETVEQEKEALDNSPKASTNHTKCVQNKAYCLAGSRLAADQMYNVKLLCAMQGWKFAEQYVDEITHLVVAVAKDNRAKRSLKFEQAVAAGKWILSTQWIDNCLRYKTIVHEAPYEVLDDDGEPGPNRARTAKKKLFDGFKFFCLPPFSQLDVDDLKMMLSAAGGQVVNNIEHVSISDEHPGPALLLTEPSTNLDDLYTRLSINIAPVNTSWAIFCMSSYSLKSIKGYLLCPVESLPEHITNWPKSMFIDDEN